MTAASRTKVRNKSHLEAPLLRTGFLEVSDVPVRAAGIV
jgi:hypothetical protein